MTRLRLWLRRQWIMYDVGRSIIAAADDLNSDGDERLACELSAVYRLRTGGTALRAIKVFVTMRGAVPLTDDDIARILSTVTEEDA